MKKSSIYARFKWVFKEVSQLICIKLSRLRNPCKCGYYPDRNRCTCSELQVKNYIGKISGPILDRIDICVHASVVKAEELGQKNGEASQVIRERVEKAREIQQKRYGCEKYKYNSQLPSADIGKYCYLGEREQGLLDKAYGKLCLSVRAYYKIIRVARTIADLSDEENIKENHLAEALGYRTDLF